MSLLDKLRTTKNPLIDRMRGVGSPHPGYQPRSQEHIDVQQLLMQGVPPEQIYEALQHPDFSGNVESGVSALNFIGGFDPKKKFPIFPIQPPPGFFPTPITPRPITPNPDMYARTKYATQDEANAYTEKLNQALREAGLAEGQGEDYNTRRQAWLADYEAKSPRPVTQPMTGPVDGGFNIPVQPQLPPDGVKQPIRPGLPLPIQPPGYPQPVLPPGIDQPRYPGDPTQPIRTEPTLPIPKPLPVFPIGGDFDKPYFPPGGKEPIRQPFPVQPKPIVDPGWQIPQNPDPTFPIRPNPFPFPKDPNYKPIDPGFYRSMPGDNMNVDPGFSKVMDSGKNIDPGFNRPIKGIPSYKTGGVVKETGLALVHKGEQVIPANQGKVMSAQDKKSMRDNLTHQALFADFKNMADIWHDPKMPQEEKQRQLDVFMENYKGYGKDAGRTYVVDQNNLTRYGALTPPLDAKTKDFQASPLESAYPTNEHTPVKSNLTGFFSPKTYDVKPETLSPKAEQGLAMSKAPNVVGGVDISRYATDPEHEKKIAMIHSKLPDFKTPDELTSFMDSRAPGNKLTGQLIFNAAEKYKIDPKLITAIIYNDSLFGTTGLGAKTKNAGNVGNNDAGQKVKFKTWQDGINAVAETLSSYKSKTK